ncbi:MAG TPA: metallopeptidase TldD-related protein [Bryobacteraceae bacterium]|nr:metallopeptidase TldD-related protein [Bryobacteraceae bacterium]
MPKTFLVQAILVDRLLHRFLASAQGRASSLLALLTCLLLGGGIVFAADNQTDRSLLEILQSEIQREFEALKAKANPAPYFLAYEVMDEQSVSASASLGAVMNSAQHQQRGVDTTIRVGSPKFDNYHPYRGAPARFTTFTALSLDDDANQIKRALWAESDHVYRLASRRFLQLQTDSQLLAQQASEDADFSSEERASYAQLPPIYRFDTDAWTGKLRGWSAEFRTHPKILGSGVSFQAEREVRTLVNTEGTAVQQGSNLFRVEVQAAALAPDGMELSDFASFEASDPAHLPSDKMVETKVQALANRLDALVNAPPAEPIVCPAILSGRASAVFFHEIFGHAIEGHRQKNMEEGQTFTKMLNQKVLPDFISVEFDPTRKQFDGADLIGSYEYDDEGVKSRPVKLVEGGVLKTFLLSRSPVGEFQHSNGHGRRQPGYEVESRQSNLIVESSRQVSDSELRRQLIAEIKRQSKPYGLYFEEVSSGYTTTARRGLQAFTVVPLVVYRVYADGRPDELVRGVDIVGTRLASFSKILATSDKSDVFNGYCGAESGSIPVSAISPAILISEVETQKKANSQQQLPILPRPVAE